MVVYHRSQVSQPSIQDNYHEIKSPDENKNDTLTIKIDNPNYFESKENSENITINNNNNNNDNNILLTSFECEICNKNYLQIDLYFCILCNSNEKSVEYRKYYCKSHLLLIHKERKNCQNHKNTAINSINNNLFKPPSIIEKLTLDIALYKSKQELSIQSVKKALKIFLNKNQDTITQVATSTCNVAADGALIVKNIFLISYVCNCIIYCAL